MTGQLLREQEGALKGAPSINTKWIPSRDKLFTFVYLGPQIFGLPTFGFYVFDARLLNLHFSACVLLHPTILLKES